MSIVWRRIDLDINVVLVNSLMANRSHGLSCSNSAGRHSRHTELNNVVHGYMELYNQRMLFSERTSKFCSQMMENELEEQFPGPCSVAMNAANIKFIGINNYCNRIILYFSSHLKHKGCGEPKQFNSMTFRKFNSRKNY